MMDAYSYATNSFDRYIKPKAEQCSVIYTRLFRSVLSSSIYRHTLLRPQRLLFIAIPILHREYHSLNYEWPTRSPNIKGIFEGLLKYQLHYLSFFSFITVRLLQHGGGKTNTISLSRWFIFKCAYIHFLSLCLPVDVTWIDSSFIDLSLSINSRLWGKLFFPFSVIQSDVLTID